MDEIVEICIQRFSLFSQEPYFDLERTQNVTALSGVDTRLVCRVRRIGNYTVRRGRTYAYNCTHPANNRLDREGRGKLNCVAPSFVCAPPLIFFLSPSSLSLSFSLYLLLLSLIRGMHTNKRCIVPRSSIVRYFRRLLCQPERRKR